MKVLTTFAFGDQADLLDVSLPTFRQYALRHNYHLFVTPQPVFDRPWSWFKIPLILSLLQTYETVLWLDADVAVVDYSKDILDDCSDAPFNLVVHETRDGKVPNLGVFVARQSAIPILKQMWEIDGYTRSNSWWEQAAFISVAGGDPDATPTETPPSEMWSSLPYEWNPHLHDRRGIQDGLRFFHATMFPDRMAVMKTVVEHGASR
jgi:hypothetical protein